jgi:hypothetical protein
MNSTLRKVATVIRSALNPLRSMAKLSISRNPAPAAAAAPSSPCLHAVQGRKSSAQTSAAKVPSTASPARTCRLPRRAWWRPAKAVTLTTLRMALGDDDDDDPVWGGVMSRSDDHTTLKDLFNEVHEQGRFVDTEMDATHLWASVRRSNATTDFGALTGVRGGAFRSAPPRPCP